MKKLNKKAFTIVEMVVVIAVIAVLAAVLIPTFASLIRKSRVSNDSQLIRNLNTALSESKINSEHATMTDALAAAADYGFDVAKINAKVKENEILWDSANDVFCYLNEGKVEYLPDSVKDSDKLAATDYRLWKIYTDAPKAEDTYSIYVAGQAAADYVAANDVAVSVDCGNYAVSSVSYKNTGAAKTDVVIRTNSLLTDVTVNAPLDEVAHYGKAKSVNVVAVKPSSYSEKGTVSFLEVTEGRVVLAKEAVVDTLYLNKQADTNTFANITIKVDAGATMPEVKRDSVGTALGDELVKVCVVETAEKTETIYLKGNGTIEDEKVYVSTTGNANDAVAVTEVTASATAKQIANAKEGDAVVDNGNTAEQKAEVKETVEETAISNEVVAQAEEDGKDYEARVGTVGYDSFVEAVKTATAGQTVTLLKDVTLGKWSASDNVAVAVNKNLTIDGNGHTIATSAGRGIWVSAGNVALTVKNLTLKGTADTFSNPMERGVQVNGNMANCTLNIVNCNIDAKLYAINICNGGDNVSVSISGSTIQGWSALQTWSNGYTFTVKDSTLIGVNYTGDKTYAFATVCLEGDSTNQTTLHSSNNVVRISNTTLRADNPGDGRTNGQYIVGFNSLSENNTVELVDCTVVVDAAIGRLSYNNGTNNSLTFVGGTYNADPAAYVKAGYATHANGDGTYTVVEAGFKVDVTYAYSNITADPSTYDVVYVDAWNGWGMQGMQDAEGNYCPQYLAGNDTTLYRDLSIAEGQDGDWVSGQDMATTFVGYYANASYRAWATKFLFYENEHVVSYYFETEAEADAFVAEVGGVKAAL